MNHSHPKIGKKLLYYFSIKLDKFLNIKKLIYGKKNLLNECVILIRNPVDL